MVLGQDGLLVGLRGHRLLGRLLGRPLLGHLERALLRRLVEVEEGLRDLEGAELVVPSEDSVVLPGEGGGCAGGLGKVGSGNGEASAAGG